VNPSWIETAYVDGTFSGLLTAVAAGTSNAGHLWACRFATSSTDDRKAAVIQRLRVRGFTVSGYTAAQEVLLAVYKLTGYTTAHTGGFAIVPQKKKESFTAPLMTGRCGNTGALTAGTHTIGGTALRAASFAELAAGATIPKGSIDILMSTEDLDRYPLVLANNEGILVRNEIAMGAGGTMRIVVEMDWNEVTVYP
jgi:hypothetical protein